MGYIEAAFQPAQAGFLAYPVEGLKFKPLAQPMVYSPRNENTYQGLSHMKSQARCQTCDRTSPITSKIPAFTQLPIGCVAELEMDTYSA
jgi:hypothetical protein